MDDGRPKTQGSLDYSLKIGQLCVTEVCNNRCRWCYNTGKGFTDVHMHFDLAKDIIELYKYMGVEKIAILGGEPTMYHYFFDVLNYLTSMSIMPTIITNGRKFSDIKFARQFSQLGVKFIIFSAKAANKNQYIQITGSDGYNELIEGYHNLQSLGVDVDFTITLVNEVLDVLPEFIGNLLEEGISRLSINSGGPIFIDGKVVVDSIPDPKKMATAVQSAYSIIKESNISYDFFLSMPLCVFPEKFITSLIIDKKLTNCCHVRKGRGVTFDHQGNVLICNHFGDYPVAQFKKDFTTPVEFSNFWYGESMKKVRDVVNRFPSESCITCKYWDECGGGCFMNWTYWNPVDYINNFS